MTGWPCFALPVPLRLALLFLCGIAGPGTTGLWLGDSEAALPAGVAGLLLCWAEPAGSLLERLRALAIVAGATAFVGTLLGFITARSGPLFLWLAGAGSVTPRRREDCGRSRRVTSPSPLRSAPSPQALLAPHRADRLDRAVDARPEHDGLARDRCHDPGPAVRYGARCSDRGRRHLGGVCQ